jgi:hypothetical protein
LPWEARHPPVSPGLWPRRDSSAGRSSLASTPDLRGPRSRVTPAPGAEAAPRSHKPGESDRTLPPPSRRRTPALNATEPDVGAPGRVSVAKPRRDAPAASRCRRLWRLCARGGLSAGFARDGGRRAVGLSPRPRLAALRRRQSKLATPSLRDASHLEARGPRAPPSAVPSHTARESAAASGACRTGRGCRVSPAETASARPGRLRERPPAAAAPRPGAGCRDTRRVARAGTAARGSSARSSSAA